MALFRLRGIRLVIAGILSVVVVFTILVLNGQTNRPCERIRTQNQNNEKHRCSSPTQQCALEHTRPQNEDVRLTPNEATNVFNRNTSSTLLTRDFESGASVSQHLSELHTSTKPERRRSLVIFGDDRSGTTFLTRMFGEDPDIFTVYEPLWVTRNWLRSEPNRNQTRDVVDVVSALMTCRFAKNPTAMKFLSHTSKKWAPGLFKNPFLAPPVCSHVDQEKRTCPSPETVPELVESACSTHHKHSVIKVAIVRVPDRKLSNFFPQVILENPDTEIKVLHVVRDPRGSVNSRIKLHWINDFQASHFFVLPRDTCEGILQNVKFGKSLQGMLKERYKLIRYKDVASSPVKTALEIYKFAGFEMPESLVRWIVKATNPSEEELKNESKKAFSSVRNATANAEKWREESPIERIRIIERECSELFDLLGLDRLT